MSNLRAKINFANMLKIVQKSRNLQDFWTIFNIFAKLIFALKSECLYTQIKCTKIFIKFLFQDEKWTRLQYCNFQQYQHIFAVAGWNHPYVQTLCAEMLNQLSGSWIIYHQKWTYILKNSAKRKFKWFLTTFLWGAPLTIF